jgi:hypothetical protein
MRLTKKFVLVENGYYYYSTQNNEYTSPLVDKLGHLEDIEEELGIDLITLFKALKDGIWVKENIKENDYLLSHYKNYISNRSYGFVCIEYDYISYYEVFMGNVRKEMNFYLKDYRKTWALTKEELL